MIDYCPRHDSAAPSAPCTCDKADDEQKEQAPVDHVVMPWLSFEDFDALPGDVVLRRWKLRETGKYRYALIECWKTKDDYLLGNEFVVIDDGSQSDAGLRAMDYWSR